MTGSFSYVRLSPEHFSPVPFLPLSAPAALPQPPPPPPPPDSASLPLSLSPHSANQDADNGFNNDELKLAVQDLASRGTQWRDGVL